VTRPISPHTSIESLRKEAKRWLRDLRAGDVPARARLEAHHPGHSSTPGLREVQHALAREYGEESWAALKGLVEARAFAAQSGDERADEFLRRACLSYTRDDVPEKWRHAERIRVRHPEVARVSIHTAAVAGELDLVEELLARDPGQATQRGGPQGWEPLLFVCYGRLPSAKAAEHSLAIARILLDHGADANTYFLWDGTYRFTALTGAIGKGEMGQPTHSRGRELAELLLDSGADPNDAQAVYNEMLVGDDDSWLRLLLARGLHRDHRVNWQQPIGDGAPATIDFALAHAIKHRHLRRITCLLEHGGNPELPDPYNGRTGYENALVAGHLDVADLLLRHGALRRELAGHDAFVAACMRGDAAEAAALLDGHADYLSDGEPLVAAAGSGRLEVVRLLLDLGMDANAVGQHEKLALHIASGEGGDRAIVELLLERGADPRLHCYGGTACGWAVTAGDGELAHVLAERSHLVHDAARAGHAVLLAELLDADASAATAVDARGQTPLHCLPEEVEPARAVIELLVAHGARLDATDASGRTPAQVAERRGLDDLVDLLETYA
jgi:uncharacterized protein